MCVCVCWVLVVEEGGGEGRKQHKACWDGSSGWGNRFFTSGACVDVCVYVCVYTN